jgi:hypothetical protein
VADLISFEDALAATDGDDRALVVGNGFSAEYFSYENLLARSGVDPDTALGRLFTALRTVDFEAVIESLTTAAVVERAYGDTKHSDQLTADAQVIREALVRAVNETHPAHRNDLAFKYDPAAKFLHHFASVFSLNYDLLLYWVNLERAGFNDGFGLGSYSANGRFRGPFKEAAYCSVYNIHGGLHLFEEGEIEVYKALDAGEGVISTITEEIRSNHRLPIYVAEASSQEKMRKINSIPYLRHCYKALESNTAPVFVYGHSAADNDAHIYRAIFRSGAKHLYFGVHKPDAEKLAAFDGQLARYQKTTRSDVEYTFYDSASAAVWG